MEVEVVKEDVSVNEWGAVDRGWLDSNAIITDLWFGWVEENSVSNESDWYSVIMSFFDKISNQNFDWLFDDLEPSLRRSQEMKDHFTSFRMSPFLAWIEWHVLNPANIQYAWKTPNWNDEYHFDLSYVLSSTSEQYNENWKVVTKNLDWDVKIASIMCETPRCSYHPIFWPENFGLMR